MQNVLIGGTFLDVDLKRAAETLGLPKGKDERDFAAHMKVMEPGTFVALGRAISKERIGLKVGVVQTSHPQPGSAKHAAEPPPPPEKVRELLPKLADLPKVAEQKARTTADLNTKIRALTNEVTGLKKQLAERPSGVIERIDLTELEKLAQAEAERILRTVLRPQLRRAVGGNLEGALTRLQALAEALKTGVSLLDDGEQWSVKLSPAARAGLSRLITTSPMPTSQTSGSVPTRRAVPAEGPGHTPSTNGNGHVTPAQLRILGAIAQFEAIGRPSVG